jgi:DNA-binding transcriptional MerR regulator
MPRSEEALTAAGIARVLSEKHGLGDTATIFRLVRHLTAQGLLDTTGAVNTGSGRRRLYSTAALVNAAVLLRLHRLGGSVGQMREVVSALKRGLKADHQTTDIVSACVGMERPTLFIFVPDDSHAKISVRLKDWSDAIETLNPARDVLVIQLKRFL